MNIKGMHEENKRSIMKTVSWRIVSTVSTMLTVYIITGQLDLTVNVGLIDIFLRMPLYFFHERVWNKSSFGRSFQNIKSILRTPPVTASQSETISNLIHKMILSNIGAIIITKDDIPVGLVTERDILSGIVESQENPKILAKDIMSFPVVSIEHDQPLNTMLKIMRERKVRRLVVTKNGEVEGIMTERRIFEALAS
jgi:CBS domain-containing protein